MVLTNFCIFFSSMYQIKQNERSILIIVQQDATQSSILIILQVHSTCFGCQPHPSSGVHTTVTTASSTGHIFCAADTTLIKFIIFTSLLSLGGLPPFLGFLPKWIVIQAIITNNIAPLATVVVVTSLITLYYYLKISYSSFIRYFYLNNQSNGMLSSTVL